MVSTALFIMCPCCTKGYFFRKPGIVLNPRAFTSLFGFSKNRSWARALGRRPTLPLTFCSLPAALISREPRQQTNPCIRFWVFCTSCSKPLCQGWCSRRRSFCFPFPKPPRKIKQAYCSTENMAVVFFLENYKILIDELNPLPPRSNCAQTAAGAFCHHGRSRWRYPTYKLLQQKKNKE